MRLRNPGTLHRHIPRRLLFLFRSIGREAQAAGVRAWAVGGSVRDLLLGRSAVDLDVTVEGDGIAFADRLAQALGGRVAAVSQFGTALVVLRGFKVDVATARSECYEIPGALPSVRPDGLRADLFRRDFTFNALALDLMPASFLRLVDPFGGVEDLRRGLVRVLHSRSFEDDPTRIYRAVRFERRFGRRLEPETERHLRAAVRGGFLDRVTGERLRNEIQRVFGEPHLERAVWRLEELGVWRATHRALGLSVPGRRALAHLPRVLRSFPGAGDPAFLRWTAYFQVLLAHRGEREAQAVAKRLRLSRSEEKILRASGRGALSRLWGLGTVPPPSRIHAALGALPAEVRVFLAAAAPPALGRRLRAYERRRARLRPLVTGEDLKRAGLPAGPAYRRILEELFAAQLDGKLRTRPRALRMLEAPLDSAEGGRLSPRRTQRTRRKTEVQNGWNRG